ncbi:MAG: GIY-YIG nuclease family protein [Deltaproteobacteria bacterium]|nr:MAG: GIY-YIG nuclease family protein [Deltaproteobacteria bacterium]
MAHFLYILRSEKDGSYYVGTTQDVEERVRRHNQGRSVYTKAKRPWQVVYVEEHSNRVSAQQREREIKQRKSKAYIVSLVSTSRQS